jgi:hypothetical protein
MRMLLALLVAQVVLATVLIVLVVTGTLGSWFDGDSSGATPATEARTNRFDGPRAFRVLEMQVRYGPRPAGSRASRRLASRLKRMLPSGAYQAVPGGLRNIVGTVPGRDPRRLVVVGAHYDTKDIPGFVGANDGAGGTAAVVELARALRPRTIGPTVKFVLFDGEESPRGTPDTEAEFQRRGLRGARVAARAYRSAEAMILLDFVADKNLSIPREASSSAPLWAELRAAAKRAGVISHFPPRTAGAVSDDHTPFLRRGIPSIDLIDFTFPCWHRLCDDLSAVSEPSLDASGEAVANLLPTL